jgi:DNA-binding LytR/AlgR family response regulator
MAPLIYGLGLAIGWAKLSWLNAFAYLVPSFAISGIMAGIGVFLNQMPQVTHGIVEQSADQSKSGLTTRPKFLDRLPPRLFGATIIAVEAQDHYLKVHTSRGADMILMRLSDALGELDGIEGAQVHRSWWVARNSLLGAQRGNGKATLTLTGDLKVPVSRSYARALREDKWF